MGGVRRSMVSPACSTASGDAAALVELRDITKSFGSQAVLRGVSYDLRPGEVHVVAGENGAGKSTLIKILAGVHGDFGGTILVRGRPRRFQSPFDARAAGIAVIHQELSLVGGMSVADNLFLGRELRTRLGTVAARAERREAGRLLREVGLDLDVGRPLGSFPISVRQLVEIARAIATGARVVIMDEPTSALNEPEAERLQALVQDLRGRGRGIVYITHELDEIYRLADRITVLRDGVRIGTSRTAELPRARLIEWMVGRALGDLFPRRAAPPGRPVLEVRDLAVADPRRPGARLVDGVTFTLHEGEILGLAGLQGSGATQVLHALFGDGRARGDVTLDGRPLTARTPRRAIDAGIALLTNDRRTTGIVPQMSLTGNATLASLGRFSRFGLVRRRREAEAVAELARRLAIAARSTEMPVAELSGGNQQKVVLARWLLTRPRILLLDEPTRGIDVGAKADVYAWMRDHAAAGGSILLATSEMDELLGLTDRILVLYEGRVTTELATRDATPEAVLHAAMQPREGPLPWSR